MGALVLLTAVFALLFPEVFGALKPTLINPLLGVVMFGMGLTLKLEDFKVVFSRPKDVIIGCLAQFIVMPLLAWLLAWGFSLSDELALGVVLVGCCPGGTASNVITYLAKGDLALSVGMTGVSTLLAPLLTPFLTWLLVGQHVNVDMVSMFLSILWVVILPIVAGLLFRSLLPKFTESAVAAISIEVGMQNSGLASSLATLHFAAYPMATIPGALFSVWHNISGAVMAKVYSAVQQRAKAD